MAPPRILLVDDQRQVNRVLRSALEISSRDYIINDVSSAEEALLEIDRGPVDLLVTDLRLPGMTGLELVERVRATHPQARTILITGDATEDVRRRAEALGVIAFLRKPIGTNMFLEIVEHALSEPGKPARATTHTSEPSPAVVKCLMDLRQEMGAEAVMLLNDRGQQVARAGDVGDFDLQNGLPSLMAAHQAALKVSQFLGAEKPSNFHHFNGDSYDLYLTDVGETHILLSAFRGRQEAGQLGAVLHFGRRGAEELLRLLSAGEREAEPVAATSMPSVAGEVEVPKKDLKPEDLEQAAKEVENSDAELFWEQAATETPGPAEGEGDALTYEQARKLGLVDDKGSKADRSKAE